MWVLKHIDFPYRGHAYFLVGSLQQILKDLPTTTTSCISPLHPLFFFFFLLLFLYFFYYLSFFINSFFNDLKRNTLIAAGITPFVVLYHWDLPNDLPNSWLADNIVCKGREGGEGRDVGRRKRTKEGMKRGREGRI